MAAHEIVYGVMRYASAAGFGSAAYLRNLFRKQHGMTMREYRSQKRGMYGRGERI